MSNLSAFPYITERAPAVPALWNDVYSILSANIAAVDSGVSTVGLGNFQQLSIGSTPPSYLTTAAITVAVNSAFSDYLYLTDSSGARSNYVIGSRAGGTADGLNIWDASGATMIASFSKQSIRFFQKVVGPVFDTGGALASTYNAATFGTGVDTNEVRIQAAINQASIDGFKRVYIPASMSPYTASLVSFINSVQMVREGGDWSVYDVRAYGAAADGIANDQIAIVSAKSAAVANGGDLVFSHGTYSYATSPNFAHAKLRMRGQGTVTLKHTGSGIGFDCDGGAAGGGLQELNIDSFALEGNSATSVGFHFRAVHRSVFRRLTVNAMSHAANSRGFWTEWIVLNRCDDWAVSGDLPSNVTVPRTGFYLDQRAAGEYTAANEFINLKAEVMQASGSTGLYLANTLANVFLGGVAESNFNNVVIASGALDNRFLGFYCEDAGGIGILNSGTRQQFTDCYSVGGFLQCLTGASQTLVSGGHYSGISIDPGAVDTVLDAPVLATALVDAGTRTTKIAIQTEAGGTQSSDLSAGADLNLGSAGRLTLGGSLILTRDPDYTLLYRRDGGIGLFLGGVTDQGNTYQNNYHDFRTAAGAQFSKIDTNGFFPGANSTYTLGKSTFAWSGIILGDGVAIAPRVTFGSEVSLGWYRSGVSTMALSYGTFNLSQSRLVSVRTTASLDSTTLATNEMAFSLAPGSSGASLAIRSGGTIYYFSSSNSTKG